MDSLIPRLIARLATPLILALALYLFLRGHHNPGGGFIAGLIAASALVLQAVVGGRQAGIRYFPVPGWVLIGLGLAFAAGTGIASMVLAKPFLTHFFGPVHLGELEVELATAQLFDLGVFLVVVGTTQSVILNIAGDRDDAAGEETGAAQQEAVSPHGSAVVNVAAGLGESEGGDAQWNS